MIIGILKLELYLPGNSSLKEKRMVLKSLKDRARRSFNISISELGEHDKWQRSVIGIAAIGMTRDMMNSLLDKVLNFIENTRDIEISNYEMEII
ncbi:MAG: DUF503 domain-containing protein [Candidatus Omnitrophica bacterium CG07_land_8_20_14_0_80_42_15]|uniref:DUF503 domain-containing protein n=1 Tax=Candidatus Aquitaenariimonas noxiae TaxID=1974741 RepID=A0A2J0KUI7_9BACT|nr:MAG: DUF503 domain-containing protein [Candidatus Omnitrophica bacterium CG07_land_8_20_14_0_80_42_15]